MKFSHTLSLNSNPDWADYYIDYASLKKKINEVSLLVKEDDDDLEIARERFLQKLTKMVTTVREFYDQKRAELHAELTRLQAALEVSTAASSISYGATAAAAAAAAEESPLLRRSLKLKSLSNMNSTDLEDKRREICDLFTQYHSLKGFAELNCTAVRKILKKYDKVLNDNLKETHLGTLKVMLPFWDGSPELERSMEILKDYFAHFYCNDSKEEAIRQMQLWVREYISYQRHSVWLDVIQDQRKHESAQMKVSPQLASMVDSVEKPKTAMAHMRSSTAAQLGMFCFAIFLALLWVPGIFDDDPTKRNALALFVFVSLVWATEALPLFVTAMLVPFLTVLLRVIVVDGTRLDAHAASQHVFAAMFSHVIMLLIGGFSIAAALSKHNIAKMLASNITIRCGSGIRTVLLVNMLIGTIASMWISNVAAPVLCYSLIAPILKAASAETSRAAFGTAQRVSADRDHRLCRALVMGIALACNVGGMASPISSPQNLFAIEYTPIGWVSWFVVSIPLCLVLDVLLWWWLVLCFQLPTADSSAVAAALHRSTTDEPFTTEQYFVTAVSVGVVLLWCASSSMEETTGQMGVLGIVPFVMFFGTGILSKEDLNNFLWSVVILAMGGLVLGEAVEKSGLLDVIAEAIAGVIEEHSLNLWKTACIFTFMILFCTTFVSHTVGAIVVLPIVKAVGDQMEPVGHAKELVFVGALACSASMGLPVSGFPNMTAISVEDNLGNRFLTTKDFLKYAVPASIFSWAMIVTLAYGLILFSVRIDTTEAV